MSAQSSQISRLSQILESMILPEGRKTPACPANLAWLGRNMFLRNRHHPDLNEARQLLRDAGARLVL